MLVYTEVKEEKEGQCGAHEWKEHGFEVKQADLNPGSVTYQLSDLGQVTVPL